MRGEAAGPDRIRRVFDEVVGLDGSDRSTRLDELCSGDAALRAEVESLLAAVDEPRADVRQALNALRPKDRDEAGTLSDALGADFAKALKPRYVLGHQIGEGGMATVFLAEDRKHNRSVAVKVLHPGLSRALGTERFLREIELAANLRHPHIMPLFDSGEAVGLLYYVMPYVEGESLRARLDREAQLPIADAVRIASEVSDALAYAHEKGVTHRDVKPANIMLEAGHAVLADFGVATAMGGASAEQLTNTGMSPGTPAYMSPEQASGKNAVDSRSDQYALGCVLYEMLAGAPPFAGARAEALLRQHLAADPPAVTGSRPTVPAGIAAAIRRTLAKSPADRFRDMRELGMALAAGLPSDEGRAPAAQPRSTRTRRRTPALIGLATLVVAAALIAIWWARRGDSDFVDNRVIVAFFENRTGDPTLDPLGRIAADMFSEGLMETGVLQVVPSMSTYQLSEGATPGGEEWRRLAEATDAGLVVRGEYFLRDGELRIQTHIMDAAAGVLLSSPPAVQGPVADRMALLGEARGRIMSALAATREPLLEDTQGLLASPPAWEAYVTYAQGIEADAAGEFRAARALYIEAARLDPGFTKAALMAGFSGVATGPGPAPVTDSLLEVARRDRAQLSPGDRALLDWAVAFRDLDPVAARGAFHRHSNVTAHLPGHWEYLAGWTALWDNRPHEAVAHFERVDIDGPGYGRSMAYWLHVSEALHRTGALDAAVDAVDRGDRIANRPVSPDRRLYSLAALGDVARISATLEDLVAQRSLGSNTVVGPFPRVIAELRAHGHDESLARAVIDRATALLEGVPADEREAAWYRYFRAGVAFSAGDIPLASRLIDELAGDTAAAGILGYAGVLAAMRGDTATALRISDEIGRRFTERSLSQGAFGARAGIAARLGRLDEAMDHLRRGREAGAGVFLAGGPHAGPLLEPLYDDPDFQAFIRPDDAPADRIPVLPVLAVVLMVAGVAWFFRRGIRRPHTPR